MTAPADRALDGSALLRALRSYRDVLEDRREHLDAINVFPVADGDTGTNLLFTVDATIEGVGDTEEQFLLPALARSALLAGRGASGLIFSQALIGFCSRLGSVRPAGERLAGALSGAGSAAAGAVVDPVEGTLITAARDASGAAVRAARVGGGEREVIVAARVAAWRSVAESPARLTVLAEAGVVDSGAVGYALFLDAMTAAIDAGPISPTTLPGPPDAVSAPSVDRREVLAVVGGVGDGAGLRVALGRIGSSVGVSFHAATANVHVHTDRIAAAVDVCRAHGTVERLEVTDLVHQVDRSGAPTVVIAADVIDGAAALIEAGAHRFLVPGDPAQLLPAIEPAGGTLRVVAVGAVAADGLARALDLARRSEPIEIYPSAQEAAFAIQESPD